MDLRRAAEVLLRSQCSLSSAARARASTSSECKRISALRPTQSISLPIRPRSCRTISSTTKSSQQAAAARPDLEDEDEQRRTQRTQPSSDTAPLKKPDLSFLNSMLEGSSTSRNSPSHFHSPSAQEANRSSSPNARTESRATASRQPQSPFLRSTSQDKTSTTSENRPQPSSSQASDSALDELMASSMNEKSQHRSPFLAPDKHAERRYRPHEMNIAAMLGPKSAQQPSTTSQSRYGLSPLKPLSKRPDEKPMRLSPATGRTIAVNKERGMDVGKAIRSLEMLVARNGVKRDFNKQRFHERGGLKRKRLKSERWRKRFKENFQGTVARVQALTRKGW